MTGLPRSDASDTARPYWSVSAIGGAGTRLRQLGARRSRRARAALRRGRRARSRRRAAFRMSRVATIAKASAARTSTPSGHGQDPAAAGAHRGESRGGGRAGEWFALAYGSEMGIVRMRGIGLGGRDCRPGARRCSRRRPRLRRLRRRRPPTTISARRSRSTACPRRCRGRSSAPRRDSRRRLGLRCRHRTLGLVLGAGARQGARRRQSRGGRGARRDGRRVPRGPLRTAAGRLRATDSHGVASLSFRRLQERALSDTGRRAAGIPARRLHARGVPAHAGRAVRPAGGCPPAAPPGKSTGSRTSTRPTRLCCAQASAISSTSPTGRPERV